MSHLKSSSCTLPSNLIIRHSGLPGNTYSIWCEKAIAEGMRFGPYESITFDYDKQHLKDSRSQGKAPDEKKISRDQNLNWLGYINCTSDMEQQNLIMYECQGHIFCISTKHILAGMELLAWHVDKSDVTTRSSNTNNKKSLNNLINENACNELATNKKDMLAANLSVKEKFLKMEDDSNKRMLHVLSASGLDKQKNFKKMENSTGSTVNPFCLIYERSRHDKCSYCQKKFIQLFVFHIDERFPALKNFTIYGDSNVVKKSQIYTEKPKNTDFDVANKILSTDILIAENKIICFEKAFVYSMHKNEFSQYYKLQNSTDDHGKIYELDACTKKFVSESTLISPERAYVGEKPLECNKKFAASPSLETDLRNHNLDMEGGKHMERKSYVWKFWRNQCATLEQKYTSSIKENSCVCSVCDAIFQTKCSLQKHWLIHTKEEPYECEVCNKKLQTYSQRKIHEWMHRGGFACDRCGKMFTDKWYLQIHKIIHAVEKPYECAICNKKYGTKSQLTEHKVIHTEEKPFACDICNKKFKLKHHRERHQASHGLEKPFICEICNKKFITNQELKIHNIIHTAEMPF